MYVSLGSSCAVAYQLDNYGMRTIAHPFDWVRTPSWDSIIKCYQNKFIDFIESVIPGNKSDKFPLSTDDNFPKDKSSEILIMKNKYGINFYHDFTSISDIEKVNEKYKRRIERFMNLSDVHFVRDEMKIPKNFDEYQNNLDTFLSFFNNCTITILFSNVKKQNLPIPRNPLVTFIDDQSEFGDWTRPNVDWCSIFNAINLRTKTRCNISNSVYSDTVSTPYLISLVNSFVSKVKDIDL